MRIDWCFGNIRVKEIFLLIDNNLFSDFSPYTHTEFLRRYSKYTLSDCMYIG